ncbi:hypothetical protein AYO44_10825 [Planctomycetaceae bacterium SCGC AG-212-F19]|nr:hypothetical protein AYO44_10825 [Planctomycetaceae bacterium SCGC AG-212-F19]
MRRLFSVLLLWAGVAALSSAGPHPFHDDGGFINWRLTSATAIKEAQANGKPIFALGTFEKDDNSKNVATALREPELYKLVNRYFIPVVINCEKADIKDQIALFPREKIGGTMLPFISFLNERGQFIQGSSGARDKDQLLADLKKVLNDKNNSVAPLLEATLVKQADMLQKALEAKNFKQAGTVYAAIVKVRGYSPSKDKTYDLMDEAQFDAVRLLKEAVALADMNQFGDARKLIADIPKEFAGLPVVNEMKEHQESLMLLEAAYKTTEDKKGLWQQTALGKINSVLMKYPDGAYSAVALKRKAELMPPKK